ncbi:MAG: ribulose-phosphate 3-epimerase [Rikenellaceae bacterium]|nr:ribulose-phosphate 3-epimerase [Rikenellaceae bacterium]
MGKHRILSPSMLSADFGNLERDTRLVDESAAEWVHIDVMDGVFVPNISFGFPVLKAIRQATRKFLDVHLMITRPMRYAERFVRAGSDLVTIHFEAVDDPAAALREIRGLGVKSGISIKPATPVSVLEGLLEYADVVLLMSVEPGFGGQSYIEGSTRKIMELRRMTDAAGTSTLIEVDGGINASNAGEVFRAGADVVVAGYAVFGADDPAGEILKILNA